MPACCCRAPASFALWHCRALLDFGVGEEDEDGSEGEEEDSDEEEEDEDEEEEEGRPGKPSTSGVFRPWCRRRRLLGRISDVPL